jgi:hypothetical protein
MTEYRPAGIGVNILKDNTEMDIEVMAIMTREINMINK